MFCRLALLYPATNSYEEVWRERPGDRRMPLIPVKKRDKTPGAHDKWARPLPLQAVALACERDQLYLVASHLDSLHSSFIPASQFD